MNKRLGYDPKRGLAVRNEVIPYQGALVVSCVDCSRPGVLSEALKFDGQIHHPIDHVELKYEGYDGGGSFRMRDESESTGSRVAGIPVRNKLANLLGMLKGNRIVIDFDGVPIISSFADEVFAKLFVELGPMGFMRAFEFINASATGQALIDRAIEQRTKEGP